MIMKVSKLKPNAKAATIGIFMFGNYVGIFVINLLGGYLCTNYSYIWPFFISFVAFGLSTTLLVILACAGQLAI